MSSPESSSSKRKLSQDAQDTTSIKRAKNLEAVKKYHANLSGWKKVEVDIKTKFTKKKSTVSKLLIIVNLFISYTLIRKEKGFKSVKGFTKV